MKGRDSLGKQLSAFVTNNIYKPFSLHGIAHERGDGIDHEAAKNAREAAQRRHVVLPINIHIIHGMRSSLETPFLFSIAR